jgi:hypothetical protein
MQVGVLKGKSRSVVFSVSPKTVLTMNNLRWQTSARYATHNRHLRSGLPERVVSVDVTLLEYRKPRLKWSGDK